MNHKVQSFSTRVGPHPRARRPRSVNRSCVSRTERHRWTSPTLTRLAAIGRGPPRPRQAGSQATLAARFIKTLPARLIGDSTISAESDPLGTPRGFLGMIQLRQDHRPPEAFMRLVRVFHKPCSASGGSNDLALCAVRRSTRKNAASASLFPNGLGPGLASRGGGRRHVLPHHSSRRLHGAGGEIRPSRPDRVTRPAACCGREP